MIFMKKINIFWFRRDLRLDDNTGLENALRSGLPVLLVFIFDTNITDELPPDDPRISFIYETIFALNSKLKKAGSSVLVLKGDPVTVWNELIVSFDINAVYLNKGYEQYDIQRDYKVEEILRKVKIPLLKFKDHVIYEESEILKSDNNPYSIFTPYKNKWLQKLSSLIPFKEISNEKVNHNYLKNSFNFPPLKELDFKESSIKVSPYDLSVIKTYDRFRDSPSDDKTTYMGPHLRFGTVSIRQIVNIALKENEIFLSELIWRDFFMQILFNFPHVVTDNFRPVYDDIQWRNNEDEFTRWCNGETGYPLVDAGMRQLNLTGYMHNRARMITAGFLCKDLLIDWRWGETYFAQKLLDYELSSNNGNWQWAAGTGCDAAPYFRIFNPYSQQIKFDRNQEYIRKWVKNLEKPDYPRPIIDHDFARKRAIEVYRAGIKRSIK
jgi:deoxyribodipyrimidine photo-lyase